jgi:lysozyme
MSFTRPARLIFLALALAGCGTAEDPTGSAAQALKVCPGPTTLEGIDVSHWDGTVDWAKVKASGRSFAFAKATEGTTYVDPKFAENWAGMKQHQLARSAYHFFHANADPIAEADHFLQTMGPLEPGDLPPTLDLEVTDGQSAATITSTAIQWLDHVAQQTGMLPILYTSPSFVTGSMGSPAGLETHALLWIANWGVTCPTVPAPYTTWGFWQYDDMGAVPGITGNVDLNLFDGTEADLQALGLPGSSSSSSSSSSASSSSSTSTSSSGASTSSSSSSSSGATSSSSSGGGGGAGGGGTSSSSSGAVETPGGCSCATPASDRGSPWPALALALGAAAWRRRAARSRAPSAPLRPGAHARTGILG